MGHLPKKSLCALFWVSVFGGVVLHRVYMLNKALVSLDFFEFIRTNWILDPWGIATTILVGGYFSVFSNNLMSIYVPFSILGDVVLLGVVWFLMKMKKGGRFCPIS